MHLVRISAITKLRCIQRRSMAAHCSPHCTPCLLRIAQKHIQHSDRHPKGPIHPTTITCGSRWRSSAVYCRMRAAHLCSHSGTGGLQATSGRPSTLPRSPAASSSAASSVVSACSLARSTRAWRCRKVWRVLRTWGGCGVMFRSTWKGGQWKASGGILCGPCWQHRDNDVRSHPQTQCTLRLSGTHSHWMRHPVIDTAHQLVRSKSSTSLPGPLLPCNCPPAALQQPPSPACMPCSQCNTGRSRGSGAWSTCSRPP